ncbi:MAG: Long-chain acyl-CoA thioesterase FadM [Planctomycetota bacterium]|jgi:acyl-CoA thioester hydrolase
MDHVAPLNSTGNRPEGSGFPAMGSVPIAVQEKLRDYHTITALPVQWGDQDAFGHVNNVVYIRWLESARVDLLKVCPSTVSMSGTGPGPILASVQCDFRRQLRFPDWVFVGSRITRIGRSSADIGHAIVSGAQGEIVAEGKSVIVVFDYTLQRVCRIPDDLRNSFERSMGQTAGPAGGTP